MNTLVSLPLAKLLKEKGFNKRCTAFYDLTSNTQIDNAPPCYYNLTKQSVSLPIIAEVVMWLYQNHDVWISLFPDSSSGYRLAMRKMSVHLFIFKNGLNVQTETLRNNKKDIAYFVSPVKAYEAAIKYALQNLLS